MQLNYHALDKEAEFSSDHVRLLQQYIDQYGEEVQPDHEVDEERLAKQLDKEILALQSQLQLLESQRKEVDKQRYNLALQRTERNHYHRQLDETWNELQAECRELENESNLLDDETQRLQRHLEKYMAINSLNDAFHIWYAGPYGTINGFRCGTLAVKPIDWNEINAAFGQAALLIDIIAKRIGLEFKVYGIIPMGSFAKVYKLDNRRSLYPLYLDATTFSFYPKRNFNTALQGLIACIQELGHCVADYDPTMSMPYAINIHDSKIGNISFIYGNDDETWTRSLKYMLSNLKWVVAWYTKHANTAVLM